VPKAAASKCEGFGTAGRQLKLRRYAILLLRACDRSQAGLHDGVGIQAESESCLASIQEAGKLG